MIDAAKSPRGRVFFVSWFALATLSFLWSIATPLSASPDEPAHLVKAASVVRGEFVGDQVSRGNEVRVPNYIAFTNSQACYARQADVTADCIPRVPGDPWRTVNSITSAGLYNPVYYLLVGWPSLIFHDSSGVFAIRLVSGLVSSAFLALALMIISTWRRRTLPTIAVAVASTPMIFFLMGSVNPNSLEITATLAAFVGTLSIILHPDRSLLTSRGTIVIVAASIGVNTRGLSPLWFAIALFVPLLLASRIQLLELWKTKTVRVGMIVIGAATIFALLWLRFAGDLATRGIPFGDAAEPYPFTGASSWIGFTRMMGLFFPQVNDMVGVFGWLEVPAPIEVYMIWIVLIGGLLLWSVVLLRKRSLIVVIFLGAFFAFLPAIAQAAYITSGGYIWQGRYTLPLFVILIVGIGAVLAERLEGPQPEFLRPLTRVVFVLWATGQVLTFANVLRRYVVGADKTWSQFIRDPQWQPPGGTYLLLGLFVVAVGITAFIGARWALDRNVWPVRRPEAGREERHLTRG